MYIGATENLKDNDGFFYVEGPDAFFKFSNPIRKAKLIDVDD